MSKPYPWESPKYPHIVESLAKLGVTEEEFGLLVQEAQCPQFLEDGSLAIAVKPGPYAIDIEGKEMLLLFAAFYKDPNRIDEFLGQNGVEGMVSITAKRHEDKDGG